MTTCEDCGTRTYAGICSNCHEELAILVTQRADIDFALSPEFLAKAEAQAEVARARHADERRTRC